MDEKRKSERRRIPSPIVAALEKLVRKVVGGTKGEDVPGIKGRVIDLSMDGAGLHTEVFTRQPFDVGDHIQIAVELSDKSYIKAEAEIRWMRPGRQKGVYATGVLFLRMDNEDRKKLNQFLSELDRALGR